MKNYSPLIKKIGNYSLIAWTILAGLTLGEIIYADYKNKTNKSPTSIEQKVNGEKPKLELKVNEQLIQSKEKTLENKVVSQSEDKIDNYLKALNAIESGGNTNASRYEPHLNDISYGLHQILTNTARELENKYPELPRLGNDISKSLCNPRINRLYAKTILEELSNLYDGNPKLIAAAYNSGNRRPLITRVQEQLNGFYNLNLKCDGVIGEKTKEVIKRFQKENKLKEDGILGPETYALVQKLWVQKNPNKSNPKGIVPNVPSIQDYAERFSNLVESYSRN